jgi:hypothetical protein
LRKKDPAEEAIQQQVKKTAYNHLQAEPCGLNVESSHLNIERMKMSIQF